LYFFPETFLPLPNNQPFKSVWTDKDKKDMKTLLKRTLRITRSHDIEMIGVFGTLIGVARHEGVIPWDDDLDFTINIKDRKKLLSLKDELADAGIGICPVAAYRVGPFKLPMQRWKNRLSKLYLLNRPNIDTYTSWSWPFIDVFYYTETDDKILLPDSTGDISYYKSDVFPLKMNLFENIPISIPNKLDKLLEYEYGDEWNEVCKSSSFNHRKEKKQRSGHTVLCKSLSRALSTKDLFENIWVINLDRRPERWLSTEDRLNRIGLYPRRWSATDKEDSVVADEYQRLRPKIRQGEFACYKSHLNLWKFLYESKVPYAVIFEDDISIPPSVTIKDIAKTIDDSKGFDVLLLGHCYAPFLHMKPVETSRVGSAACLHAYVVSAEGLRKLVESKHDYQDAVDDYIHKKFCTNNLCYYSQDKAQAHRNEKIWAEGLFSQDENFPTDIQLKN
jgi:hypothetical protein